MYVLVHNQKIVEAHFQVPSMNYGQLQRWKDFVPLRYSLSLSIHQFRKDFAAYFQVFRTTELEEDDPDGIAALVDYKAIGRPGLDQLIKAHKPILSSLLIYHQYELLQALIQPICLPLDFYYVVNKIDVVDIFNEAITLQGICFKSDYIEHNYHKQLSFKNALLKSKI